jgi:hypothetical protein
MEASPALAAWWLSPKRRACPVAAHIEAVVAIG